MRTKSSVSDIPKDGWTHYTAVAPWADNPNIHPEFQPETIAESIRAFGFVAPAVVWPEKDRLVAGHGRLQAMRLIIETGYDYIDSAGEIQHRDPEPDFVAIGAPGPGLMRVVFHAFPSEAAAEAYALADNEIAKAAHWDQDKVEALVKKLNLDETFGALHAIGFPQDRLAAMVAESATNLAFLGQFLGQDDDGKNDPEPLAPAPITSGQSTAKPSLVDFVVPLSVEERAKLHGIVNLAKRVAGVTSTREALILIFESYESAHTGG